MSQTTSILMSMPGELKFTKHGIWHHEGAPVTHDKVAEYFSAHICWSEQHDSFTIEVDGKCVKVAVEDTPQVVKAFDTSTLPWSIRLSSGEEHAFQPQALEVSKENVFYCRLDSVIGRIRILRSPLQTLLPLVEEENDIYYLRLDNERYPIQQIETSSWR